MATYLTQAERRRIHQSTPFSHHITKWEQF